MLEVIARARFQGTELNAIIYGCVPVSVLSRTTCTVPGRSGEGGVNTPPSASASGVTYARLSILLLLATPSWQQRLCQAFGTFETEGVEQV